MATKRKESKKNLVYDYVPNMNSTLSNDTHEQTIIYEFYQEHPTEYVEFIAKQRSELLDFIKNFESSEGNLYP